MLLPETKCQEQISCLEKPPTLKKYMARKYDNNLFNCTDLQFFFVQLSVWQLDIIIFHLFRTEKKKHVTCALSYHALMGHASSAGYK